MLKKIMCILLAVLTFSMLAASCTDSETSKSNGENTAESTEKNTETDAESDAGKIETSEKESEAETEDPDIVLQKKQEEMKKIYEATEDRLLPIGGWSTPASALRDGATGTAGSLDAVFKSIADSGINYMATLEEWSSGTWPLEVLSSAKKSGIKIWYNCVGQETSWSYERIKKMLESEDADALAGIYIKDEPTINDMDAIAKLTREMREALGEQNKIPVFSNLLPSYAPSSSIGNYADYVKTYVEKTSPDILIFDYYPYGGSGDTIPAMMENIAIIKKEADSAGIPMYSFIQSSGWPGMREPNQAELLLDVNINLAMGTRGINYFLICEHYAGWEYSSMISAEGKVNASMFKKIKGVNDDILAMKGVYLDYSNKGVILANYDKARTQLEKAAPEILLDKFASLTEINSAKDKKVVIGCFENDEKKQALYVVNAEYSSKNNITLSFDSEISYKIWSDNGLEDMGMSDKLELSLDRGEGVFITID